MAFACDYSEVILGVVNIISMWETLREDEINVFFLQSRKMFTLLTAKPNLQSIVNGTARGSDSEALTCHLRKQTNNLDFGGSLALHEI